MASSAELNCVFTLSSYESFPIEYTCHVIALEVPGNLTEDFFNGEPYEGKELKDVKCLIFDYANFVDDVIPKSLGLIFPNLTRLIATNCNIKSMIKANVTNFPKLEYLNLSKNEITEVPNKLFKHHQNIKIIDLSHNKITSLKPSIFSGNSKLEIIDFRDNPGMDFYYNKNIQKSMTFAAFLARIEFKWALKSKSKSKEDQLEDVKDKDNSNVLDKNPNIKRESQNLSEESPNCSSDDKNFLKGSNDLIDNLQKKLKDSTNCALTDPDDFFNEQQKASGSTQGSLEKNAMKTSSVSNSSENSTKIGLDTRQSSLNPSQRSQKTPPSFEDFANYFQDSKAVGSLQKPLGFPPGLNQNGLNQVSVPNLSQTLNQYITQTQIPQNYLQRNPASLEGIPLIQISLPGSTSNPKHSCYFPPNHLSYPGYIPPMSTFQFPQSAGQNFNYWQSYTNPQILQKTQSNPLSSAQNFKNYPQYPLDYMQSPLYPQPGSVRQELINNQTSTSLASNKAPLTSFSSSPATTTLQKDIEEFLKLSKFKDFKIIVAFSKDVRVNFMVHKFLFAARSPIFRKMLEDNPNLNELVLNDLSQESFKSILDFIYEDKIPKDKNLSKEIFKTAGFLKIEGLKLSSAEMLINDMSEKDLDSLMEYFDLGHKFECQKLKLRAFEEIQKNFPGGLLKSELMNDPENLKVLVEAKKKADDAKRIIDEQIKELQRTIGGVEI